MILSDMQQQIHKYTKKRSVLNGWRAKKMSDIASRKNTLQRDSRGRWNGKILHAGYHALAEVWAFVAKDEKY